MRKLQQLDIDKIAKEIIPENYIRCAIQVKNGGIMDLDARTFRQRVEEILSKYLTSEIIEKGCC